MLSDILIMQGLQEVSMIRVNSIKSLHEVVGLLARSERLGILGLSFDGLSPSLDGARAFTDLVRAVRHSKLRSLSLHCLHGDWIGLLDSRPYQLRRFEVSIPGPVLERTVFVIPCCITHMNIEVTQLGEKGLSVIASMPLLVLLKLASSGPAAPMMDMDTSLRKQRRRAIIRRGAFRCLKVFWFTCKAGGNEVQFDPGAMPQLQGLRLHFNTLETLSLYGDFEFGIEHLSSLNRIHVTLACEDTAA
uniref:Disease resistance R13L4/SHOC-2-like LRR domain-containing protein n=1 Tax=Hordeum vulgare subsp. vulgare TaxID=112509 RepID=A0A8I6WFW4_HORVV